MTDGSKAGSQPAPEPQAGHEDEQARRAPAFGHEEAEVVADAQEQAVEEDLLPPSQDEADRS